MASPAASVTSLKDTGAISFEEWEKTVDEWVQAHAQDKPLDKGDQRKWKQRRLKYQDQWIKRGWWPRVGNPTSTQVATAWSLVALETIQAAVRRDNQKGKLDKGNLPETQEKRKRYAKVILSAHEAANKKDLDARKAKENAAIKTAKLPLQHVMVVEAEQEKDQADDPEKVSAEAAGDAPSEKEPIAPGPTTEKPPPYAQQGEGRPEYRPAGYPTLDPPSANQGKQAFPCLPTSKMGPPPAASQSKEQPIVMAPVITIPHGAVQIAWAPVVGNPDGQGGLLRASSRELSDLENMGTTQQNLIDRCVRRGLAAAQGAEYGNPNQREREELPTDDRSRLIDRREHIAPPPQGNAGLTSEDWRHQMDEERVYGWRGVSERSESDSGEDCGESDNSIQYELPTPGRSNYRSCKNTGRKDKNQKEMYKTTGETGRGSGKQTRRPLPANAPVFGRAGPTAYLTQPQTPPEMLQAAKACRAPEIQGAREKLRPRRTTPQFESPVASRTRAAGYAPERRRHVGEGHEPALTLRPEGRGSVLDLQVPSERHSSHYESQHEEESGGSCRRPTSTTV